MIGLRPESNMKNFEAFAHKRTVSVLAGQSEYPLGPFPRQGSWGDHPGEKLSGQGGRSYWLPDWSMSRFQSATIAAYRNYSLGKASVVDGKDDPGAWPIPH